jgi:hypothetical protein
MYCKYCGRYLADDARFCSQCGASLGGGDEYAFGRDEAGESERASNEPVLVCKSVFNWKVVLRGFLPMGVLLCFWAAVFFGLPTFLAMRGIDKTGAGIYLVVMEILFFTVGIPAIVCGITKRNYERAEYRFYDDCLHYWDGFFFPVDKIIELGELGGAELKRNAVQKKYGLGTLYVYSPAKMASGDTFTGAVRLPDIADGEAVLETVEKLLKKNEEDEG